MALGTDVSEITGDKDYIPPTSLIRMVSPNNMAPQMEPCPLHLLNLDSVHMTHSMKALLPQIPTNFEVVS